MPQQIHIDDRPLSDRIRDGLGRRMVGILAALVLEGLIILLLLTLSATMGSNQPPSTALASFDFSPPQPPAPDEEPVKASQTPEPPKNAATAAPREASQEAVSPQNPALPQIAAPDRPAPPVIINPRPQETAPKAEPSAEKPKAKAVIRGDMTGPADTVGRPGDSARVEGSGPNGEPLYAAAWYREPYPDELAGYLSTASGPGWALIACRTVPNYKVEDCVPVAEYPRGAGLSRAVLAAAWQFRVRPPRIGGTSKVGEWVRIRIDYEQRRK